MILYSPVGETIHEKILSFGIAKCSKKLKLLAGAFQALWKVSRLVYLCLCFLRPDSALVTWGSGDGLIIKYQWLGFSPSL